MKSLERAGVHALSGALVRSGAASWLGARRRRRGDHRVVILEYHQVTDEEAEPEGTVNADRLRSHLRFLKERFAIVPLSEAVATLVARTPLERDVAVITFDDGFAGNYESAWPVLRAEGVPATVFVTTGFVDGRELWFDRARRSLDALADGRGEAPGPVLADLTRSLGRWPFPSVDAAMSALKRVTPEIRADLVDRLGEAAVPERPPARALSWDQVREMTASDDIEIGCHTVTHPILGQLSPAAQIEEIETSRARLAEETGIAPSSFAYPNGARGDFDERTIERVRAAGFTSACSTIRGANRPGGDVFSLLRLGVGADSPDVLAARVAGFFDEHVRLRLRGGC